MVNSSGRRRGTSTFGCLLMLAILIAAGYYGMHVGGAYWRYYELLDDMKQQARFAGQTTDQAIQASLAAQADSLLGERPVFRIDRGGRPSRIVIETQYRRTFDLPLFKKTIVFRPRAEAPL
jgi:hypothetical protein